MIPSVSSIEEIDALLARFPDLLVRYSHGPEADRGEASTDYESELPLPGLSCNALAVPSWWKLPTVCNYVHLERDDPNRVDWLLRGRVVDSAPDNEPVVTDWTPVAVLEPRALVEAARRYHERFVVGRDSRSG